MSEAAEGSADALDATVSTDGIATADLLEEAHAAVVGAEAKVERQRQHLAGAEQSLAAAQAALAQLEGA